jgi:transcriptional/translational regulatory protein YebC/TACO1
VAWIFEKKGDIAFDRAVIGEEALMEAALEAGAEDVREDNGTWEVIAAPDHFETVKAALDKLKIPFVEAEVTMLPKTTTDLVGKEAEQMVRLMESLQDCDDVQKVYTNADIPDEIVG